MNDYFFQQSSESGYSGLESLDNSFNFNKPSQVKDVSFDDCFHEGHPHVSEHDQSSSQRNHWVSHITISVKFLTVSTVIGWPFDY